MKINLTELLADREAGTDGPWLIDQEYCDNGATVDVVRNNYYDYVIGEYPPMEEDRRRIARLPDLEAAYIEAVELIKFYSIGPYGAHARVFLGDGE